MPNILQITPFPVPDSPTSGGEVRTVEFAALYRRAGWGVDRVVVQDRLRASPKPLDVSLGWWDRTTRQHLGRPRGLGHLRQMWALARSDRYARELAARLTRRYDLIQVEHPWDFDLAWRLREQPSQAGARIVYSAHNQEAPLQELVWRGNGQWSRAAARMVADIARHEADVARRADACWATCQADATVLAGWGARELAVVPNGVSPLAPLDPAASVPAQPYLLFVASSHLPNVVGLSEWLAPPLADWGDAGRLVLAGSVGKAMRRDGRYAADLASGRLVDAGVLPRAQLDQLIRHAHGLLLPIGMGGGTNLKTAEALVSARPVVATRCAMRGFERFADIPRLTLADTPAQFRAQALALLRAPRRADAEDGQARTLLWRHAFDPVWPVLQRLGIAQADVAQAA